LRKHNAQAQTELIDIKNQLEAEFNDTDELQTSIAHKEKEIKRLHGLLDQLGNELHDKRIEASEGIASSIVTLLADLKMPDTYLNFNIIKRSELGINGYSEVKMMFSPNKGVDPVSIDKAASGGELSRVMLVLQNLVSARKQLPTLIFDEIDTGVSGDVAQKIGQLLQKMGNHLQLIAITHLPQVAGKANHHFRVEKSNDDSRTKTHVVLLNQDERVKEIARLMSGEHINEAALLNAKALMN
jgi:DNA repair protein RecN (Recombination protein N)